MGCSKISKTLILGAKYAEKFTILFRENLQKILELPVKYNKESGKVKNYVNRIKTNILEEVSTIDKKVLKEIMKDVTRLKELSLIK